MTTGNPQLKLRGFSFTELFQSEGLQKLDQNFLEKLKNTNTTLHENLLAYRNSSKTFSTLEISELLIHCGKILEHFLIELFDIEEAATLAQAKTLFYNPIAAFKKYFVLKRAKKQLTQADKLPSFQILDTWLLQEIENAPLQTKDKELSIALLAMQYMNAPEEYAEQTEKLAQWCVQALASSEGKLSVKGWSSFHIPERIEFENLVPVVSDANARLMQQKEFRLRDGFNLTDARMSPRDVQDEVNYCIYCHDHDGDFCSKGFPNKKGDPSQGLKKNALDNTLTGCPLEEKISEMNILKRDGFTLAALAMVMVDNPMCPATGHRICNDCMKACIYQKQEPVNIPQIETSVLTDVLNLPWGTEIYDLLTRWNPLRQKQWIMKPYNGLKILIAGMGPAGFTLAHHLLLEGFAVVGFDGLKIEPLPKHLLTEPIYQFNAIKENLNERIMAGFGGVAEYGITVRWDKNFLKLIYISLARKPHFQVFGSTRFGGTITVEDAWHLGFDHFVIAVGAGLPRALSIPGSLAPGMRQANDFLMALQLGNAAKKSSLTNLQVRLPAVIIGGGLTGVDTATEVQAYYITQVEKTLARYEELVSAYDEAFILNQLDAHSQEILKEFLAHGKLVRAERERARNNNEPPNFIKLIHQWGGVTIVYRRTMQESPAYVNNHEELKKAFEEGIFYLESLEPAAALLDHQGHVKTLVCHKRFRNDLGNWETSTDEVSIPARAILVATGTQPNIAYEFEHKGTFTRLGFQYQHYEDKNGELSIAHGIVHCKEKDFGPFTSYHKDDHRVSLIGDTHPVFHGSVVKAIASGFRAYPKIVTALEKKLTHAVIDNYQDFADKMRDLFQATITENSRRTENVIELTIRAPLAAKKFQPGQFYRLQNFETFSQQLNHTTLQMEPLALIGAGVDDKKEHLKFIVIEMGTSSKLCSKLRVGELVSLMGPTGIRQKISHEHETVLIIGNQLSIALLRSYGPALRALGNKVIYVGNFNNPQEIYCQKEIEAACDVAIFITKNKIVPTLNRPQDYAVSGDLIDILFRYSKGTLIPGKTQAEIPFTDVDRICIIESTSVLREFQAARQTILNEIFVKNPKISGSVFSTMQCMLKGVCAQCLQWQVDPETGKRTKAVFACSWPEQPLELIDFDNLDERQEQNRLQERLSSMWVDYLFENFTEKCNVT